MRKFLLPFVLLASATLLSAQNQSVLMISVDGMRPDYVTRADEHGLKIPTLRAALRDGTHAEGVTGVFPTVTYPSHTTLVTGMWPAEHGILNNQHFDPEHTMAGAWYWYADDIKVPTLWSVAHAAGLRTASVGWPVTVDAKDIDFLIPEYWRGNLGEMKNPDDRLLMNAISRPENEVQKIGAQIGLPYMEGNDTSIEGDEVKTRYSLEILKSAKPKFMTLHLSSLDEEEHLHGVFSPEANADLEAIDGMIARLIAQERAIDPRSVIVIVSDHGFVDVDHALNLGVAFIKAGLMSAPGTSATWQAQPWALGSMFAIMLHDPKEEAVRQKVKALLDQLAADPANGIEAILNASQVHDAGGPPDAAYVVALRKGFTAAPSVSGDLVMAIPGHRGTHGYNPATTPEMRASFFITGEGIAQGRDLGIIDMRQIAPTVAHIMGLNFEKAKQPPVPVGN
jgi:predicted AlkP superfamily pyrophosphatase or phosphodiesterase